MLTDTGFYAGLLAGIPLFIATWFFTGILLAMLKRKEWSMLLIAFPVIGGPIIGASLGIYGVVTGLIKPGYFDIVLFSMVCLAVVTAYFSSVSEKLDNGEKRD